MSRIVMLMEVTYETNEELPTFEQVQELVDQCLAEDSSIVDIRVRVTSDAGTAAADGHGR